MIGPVASVYHTVEEARPFVRPAYNQFEEKAIPPYGDPEVHIPSEIGTYVVAGILAHSLVSLLDDKASH